MNGWRAGRINGWCTCRIDGGFVYWNGSGYVGCLTRWYMRGIARRRARFVPAPLVIIGL